MTPDTTHLTITTTEDTVTDQFHQVSHLGQGDQGGGTLQVPLLFEGATHKVPPLGQRGDREEVIQEALRGVVVIPNASIHDQAAQV